MKIWLAKAWICYLVTGNGTVSILVMREEFNEWRLNNLEATYPDTSPMDLGLHCLVRRTEQLSVKPASECKPKKGAGYLKSQSIFCM